jgi:hypothetical protein
VGLQVPVTGELVVFEPNFLVAVASKDELIVYRSVLVKDTSQMYQPVSDLLGQYELRKSSAFTDPDMMFGEGEILHFMKRSLGA